MVKGYITLTNEEKENAEVGKIYESKKPFIIYPTPEDSLRSKTLQEDKVIVEVQSNEEGYKFDSPQFDYFDMVNVKSFIVTKVLTDDDVFLRASSLMPTLATRIIKSYKLPEDMLKALSDNNSALKPAIDYYVNGNTNAYIEAAKAKQKVKVISHGFNNNKGSKGE